MDSIASILPFTPPALGRCLLCVVAVLLTFWLMSCGKKARPEPTHLLQFPPSRRHVLRDLPTFEKLNSHPEIDPGPSTLQAKALPTIGAPDLSKGDQYTPTGFSTQDIRGLGRFPDYALLSGVRHPKPCDAEFDISKATFRPFRPFRWNYHQTMCMRPNEDMTLTTETRVWLILTDIHSSDEVRSRLVG